MAWFYKLQEHMDTIWDYWNTIRLHNVVSTECTNRWEMEDRSYVGRAVNGLGQIVYGGYSPDLNIQKMGNNTSTLLVL